MVPQHLPPTSGFQHHRAMVMHMARHYLSYHPTLGDPVQAMNVPGEEPSDQSDEESAATN